MKATHDTPELAPRTPLVDVEGVFAIHALTASRKGFTVKGRGVSRAEHREGKSRVSFDSPEQATLYGNALRADAKFNNVQAFRDARDARKEASAQGASKEIIAELKQEEERQWKLYRGKGFKIGVRDFVISGDNELAFNALKVPYQAYNQLASPDATSELGSLTEASGVAMPVLTADGRLILQHRAIEEPRILTGGKTRGNGLYADIPGASVAGMVDATIDPDRRSAPIEVGTEYIEGSILKEAGEELGLSPDAFEDVRVVGLAKDAQKPHEEFLLFANTNLTAAEVYQTSRQSKRNKNLGDADFEERFIDIEGTPEAIETLVTEVLCPLPPTHTAAMVAAGYLMVLERTGDQQMANEWRDRVATKISEHYTTINQKITDHYTTYPETVTEVPERYWGKNVPKRNLTGYSAAYGPEEQGLPSFHDEMVRTGLTPETRRVVSEIHLFDIDGVLSDPLEKGVIHPELFDLIIDRLEAGEPVALNTGRSTEWAIEKIVNPILERVTDKDILENLSVIGEKGNTWAVIDNEGSILQGKAEVGVDQELVDRLATLVEENYSHMMANLDPKTTMISYEMIKGVKLADFTAMQPAFKEDVRHILEELGKESSLIVDTTTIAVDIESPYAGKALGAARFVKILKERNINFSHAEFNTYGDSASDADMAKELARRGLKGEFVYVGNDTLQPDPKYYKLRHEGGFTEGTLRVLQEKHT